MSIWTRHHLGVWSSGYALATIQIRSLAVERRRPTSTTGNWLRSSSVMQPVAWSLFPQSYYDSWIGLHKGKKVKWYRYRPGVAQSVGRGIALLFHARGTRREWVVSSTPRPQFTPEKEPVPILQEAGWAPGPVWTGPRASLDGPQGQSGRSPGPVWTGGKSRSHRESIPERPARSQSLYRLSYRAHW